MSTICQTPVPKITMKSSDVVRFVRPRPGPNTHSIKSPTPSTTMLVRESLAKSVRTPTARVNHEGKFSWFAAKAINVTSAARNPKLLG